MKQTNDSDKDDGIFHRYYKTFDAEMASVTAVYYAQLASAKRLFCSAFFRTWRSLLNSIDDIEDINTAIDGFNALKRKVSDNSNNGNIEGAIDRLFVKYLEDLMNEYSKMAKGKTSDTETA